MRIRITDHAVERYVERVKPALGLVAARQELDVLLSMCGQPTPNPPAYLDVRPTDAEGYVELADGITGAVNDGAVSTILIRSGSRPALRAAAKEAKRKERAKRRWSNRLGRSQGRHRGGAPPEWA